MKRFFHKLFHGESPILCEKLNKHWIWKFPPICKVLLKNVQKTSLIYIVRLLNNVFKARSSLFTDIWQCTTTRVMWRTFSYIIINVNSQRISYVPHNGLQGWKSTDEWTWSAKRFREWFSQRRKVTPHRTTTLYILIMS